MPTKKKHKTAVAVAAVPLALTLIYRSLTPGAPPPTADVTKGPVLCQDDIPDTTACHSKYPSGCAAPDTTKNPYYDFYLNLLKNATSWSSTQTGPFKDSLHDFELLEAKLPSGLNDHNHLDFKDELATAGEGRLQGVVGYLYGAKAEKEETSNCKLPDTADHADVDFHIYIGFDKDVAALL